MTNLPTDGDAEELAVLLDPYMRRILDGPGDPHDIVYEVTGTLTQPPTSVHLWGAGWLYRIWAELSDIMDGWPVDFGDNTETIALREYRHAAQDWLSMPRTAAGLLAHIERRKGRLAALWTSEPGVRRAPLRP